MSQPALGWLNVCYVVDKHLSLLSLYGYRLAIGYFRVEKGEVRAIRAFVVSLGVTVGYSVFWFPLRGVVFKLVGSPVGRKGCSLDPPWKYADARYVKELKLVWFGEFNINFGTSYLGIPGRLSSKCL